MPTELVANSSTPGTVVALANLGVAITTTPAPGTVESYAVTAAAPAALRAASGQFRVVIDAEIMLVAASASGASPWSFTRGAEGSTVAAHPIGVPIFHYLTAGALLALISAGPTGTVLSVNGHTGVVVLAAADVDADVAGAAAGAVSALVASADPLGDRAYSDNSPHLGTQIGKAALDGSGNLIVTVASPFGIDASTGAPYFQAAGATDGEEAVLQLNADGTLSLNQIAGQVP